MTQDNRPSPGDSPKSPWPLIGALILLSFIVELGGDGARALLRYDRAALESGQLWRLISAHLTHLGWGHSIMNLAALAILGGLFGQLLKRWDWGVSFLLGIAAIDAGLWWLETDVQWYVGLSGVLHGIIVHGALAMIANGERLGMGLLIAVVAKLLWEQWFGPLPFTESAASGPVLVDAHLYGALGGLAAAALSVRRRQATPL